MKSFNAAIAAGANAIYIGLGNFNARMKAQNFDVQNLREIVKTAHFNGVKIYVAINTILQNSELNCAFELVKEAVKAKVDGFIVQDIGVAALIRDNFKGVELHASTQMGVHNLLGAQVACKMGMKRAVLSRETPLCDIKAISEGTDIELEYFVQGALCVAFSGECYLSSVEQGASGNRGLCKQLCRLPYEARLGDFKKTGYLLSARDLCLAQSIKQLRGAGISSFKIEGRMRREGYVAKAVNVYRKFVYGAEDKLSESDAFSLKTAFSRGEYSERGYLDGGTPSVVEPRFGSHIGVEIGKITKVKPFKDELSEVILTLDRKLRDGDGLKFFDGDVEMASLGAGGVKELKNGVYRFVTSARAKAGWSVRLTLDSAEEESLLSRKATREAKIQIVARKGAPLRMRAETSLWDFDKNHIVVTAEASSEFPLEEAKTAPMTAEMLREQAKKTADSGFVVTGCDVDADNVFAPKSTVNGVRRELLEKLRQNVVAAYEKSSAEATTSSLALPDLAKFPPACPERKVHYVFSEEIFGGSVNIRRGELVTLAPCEYSADEIKNELAALDLSASEVALKLPPLACQKDIETIDRLLEAVPIKTLVAESLYGLSYAQRGYNVVAGEGMNIANNLAAAEAARLGAYAVVPSLEFKSGVVALPAADIEPTKRDQDPNCAATSLARVRVYASDYNIPLMTLAHCPYKTLFKNDCAHCTYSPGLTLRREKRVYRVRRVRASKCFFELYADLPRT